MIAHVARWPASTPRLLVAAAAGLAVALVGLGHLAVLTIPASQVRVQGIFRGLLRPSN